MAHEWKNQPNEGITSDDMEMEDVILFYELLVKRRNKTRDLLKAHHYKPTSPIDIKKKDKTIFGLQNQIFIMDKSIRLSEPLFLIPWKQKQKKKDKEKEGQNGEEETTPD